MLRLVPVNGVIVVEDMIVLLLFRIVLLPDVDSKRVLLLLSSFEL